MIKGECILASDNNLQHAPVRFNSCSCRAWGEIKNTCPAAVLTSTHSWHPSSRSRPFIGRTRTPTRTQSSSASSTIFKISSKLLNCQTARAIRRFSILPAANSVQDAFEQGLLYFSGWCSCGGCSCVGFSIQAREGAAHQSEEGIFYSKSEQIRE